MISYVHPYRSKKREPSGTRRVLTGHVASMSRWQPSVGRVHPTRRILVRRSNRRLRLVHLALHSSIAFHLSVPSKHPRAAVPAELNPHALTLILLRACRRCRHQIWFSLVAVASMLRLNKADGVGAYGPRVQVRLFRRPLAPVFCSPVQCSLSPSLPPLTPLRIHIHLQCCI